MMDTTKQSRNEAAFRWAVAWRVVLAVAGGFLIASLSVPLLALPFAETALATYSAMLASFVVWLLVIMTVFHQATTLKATGLVGGLLLLMLALYLTFYQEVI